MESGIFHESKLRMGEGSEKGGIYFLDNLPLDSIRYPDTEIIGGKIFVILKVDLLALDRSDAGSIDRQFTRMGRGDPWDVVRHCEILSSVHD
jgi:hypothetical protein